MRSVNLPHDDGFLVEFPTQWWYWTGHLATDDGRRFGFEVCFFAFHADIVLGRMLRSHLDKEGLIDRLTGHLGFQMAHSALSDIGAQSYQHACEFAMGHPPTLDGKFELATTHPHPRSVAASGGNGRDVLHVALPGWGLDLRLVNDNVASPPVLQYEGACHVYPFGGFTYYYSRPCMQASGTVVVGGDTLPVSGTVWFDRQYGELNQIVECGWQWFAIQLTDRQVVVLEITGQPLERYAAISRGPERTYLTSDAVEVQALDHWTSQATGIVYPSRWRVTFGAETVIVTPLLANQELTEPFPWPAYWEGDCEVATPDGHAIGQAYVELNGFKRP